MCSLVYTSLCCQYVYLHLHRMYTQTNRELGRKAPAAKVLALHDADVLLFVCAFVRMSVCHLQCVLLLTVGGYHVGHSGHTCMLNLTYICSSCCISLIG